ncbi:chitooligosaccharidolytic beta-N-acetylglucosaminidase-like isoform X3 [Eriocheir sinensis]|uniref:chitooligosaccharidolytic beta-N-acetylglucosaminidase-like isoform X3 n=1 Tax=Eriocheir sinensis TaxID=95602 RepID=UPI0021CAACD1|nr:chitooligosaccharidolytic beta-N-acetylglucosaminidase-like isoform X3 [Eriocheir sinensis]
MGQRRDYLAWGACLTFALTCLTLPPTYANFRPGSPWGWRCVNDTCIKEENDAQRSLPDLDTCKLTCAPESVLWPRPTGLVRLGKETVSFLLGGLELRKVSAPSPQAEELARKAFTLFNDTLASLSPRADGDHLSPEGAFEEQVRRHRVVVEVLVVAGGEEATLTPHTREAYTLSITTQAETHTTRVTLLATDFFGARHGLETLSQLVVGDEATGVLKVVTTAAVTDAPAFPYRGLLVDTSRNFVTEAALRRTLDAMAASKLNTLHWHITDSHSFPLALDTLPNMAYYGAYSPRQVYTPAQVRRLVQYAHVRGVRLLPEVDTPAHVGSGWQWAEKEEGLGRLAVCVNQEPWQKFCDEPPCGQLNPALNATYTLLGQLYTHLLDLFPSQHYFHYGATQISVNCWNTTEEVINYLNETGRGREAGDFHDLWGEFQRRARGLVAAASTQVAAGVVRSSTLTAEGRRQRYLDPEYYVIQVTSAGAKEEVSQLTQEGYRVILSDSDAWDLSCGHGDPYGEGAGSCGAYRGWQAMYGDHLAQGKEPGQVLGGEALLWTHQVDDSNLDAKVWPRAAAVAERLWTNPSDGWRDAEARFIHRQRLVRRGVQAERVQPQWCHQNEGLCYK